MKQSYNKVMEERRFYTYAYLREDATPYYIGKGCVSLNGVDRINAKCHPGISLPPSERRVKLYNNLTNEEACNKEKELISYWGRKDLGTGILYNRTDGGDDPPRLKKNNPNHRASLQKWWDNATEEQKDRRRKAISKSKKGKGNHIPSKPVIINELNKKFQSIKECADYINGDISAICRCLNKRGQTRHRGYTFSRI
jgi:hypothetical protein